MNHYFAVTAPGLADLTARELTDLGFLPASDAPIDPAGIAFSGGRRPLYQANLQLRTANRILLRLGEFRTIGFVELRKLATRLPWEHYIRAGQPVALRVTCRKSRLYHSDAVAERIVAAIGDRLGKEPLQVTFDEESDSANPPQLIVIRLLHDQCTVSLDTSGALLHRRGYRQYTGKAPLRETLAAGLLLASGWDGLADTPAPLLDPFCGSGTLPIEAALWATHTAPGLHRSFAFQQWPSHDRTLWDSILAEAVARQQSRLAQLDGKLAIQGSDRDSGVIEGAIANAERAGVTGLVDFVCRPISAITPPAGPGWLVTNPPYGLRVGEGQDLRNLYAQFGNVVRKQCPGWRVAMLSTDPALLRQTGLTLDASRSLVNGGVNVRLATGAVPPLSASPNQPID